MKFITVSIVLIIGALCSAAYDHYCLGGTDTKLVHTIGFATGLITALVIKHYN